MIELPHMMKKHLLIILLITIFCAYSAHSKTISIFLAGDSTCATMKDTASSSYRGWGQVFPLFFDESKVAVRNFAKGGASTKTFKTLGIWDEMLGQVKKGDIVLIQFGHNDENVKDSRGTTPQEYKANLMAFVKDVRSKGAQPVLLTPILRRRYDNEGRAMRSGGANWNHLQYSPMVFEVADELKVKMIDGELLSEEWLNSMNRHEAKDYFVWFHPGAYPKYINGKSDDTHLNQKGAYEIAYRFAKSLTIIFPKLKSHFQQCTYDQVEDSFGKIHTLSGN